jgi:ABC-type lipoprotein release transport system permease subunit
MIAARLGLRNLFRNRWRSALTLAAVAVAVALMVWTIAFLEGWLNEMVRGMTGLESLQAQVQTVDYVRNPRVYRTFELTPEQSAALAAVPGVVAVTPRVEMYGFIGTEQRSQVARMIGVDPVREAAATPITSAVVTGRWLAAEPPDYALPREAVFGAGLARQLQVSTGDELVVFLEAADGSLGNEVVLVVGTVETGNSQIDRGALYIHLEDAQLVAALEDGVHHLAIQTADLGTARATAAAVARAIGATYPLPDDAVAVTEGTLVVRPWQDLSPSLDQMIRLSRNSYWIMYLLIYLVAAVGVLNTQRMSAMERRREFGVMMAIGMRPRRMFRTLLVETGVLGVVGAALGAAAGGLLAWYHATHGFDLSMFSTGDTSFTYMGVTFSDRLHFVLTPAAIVQPVIIMVAVAMISGLLPAWHAARIDPAPTIAGRS